MILVRKTVFAAVAMALGDAGADLQIYIGILVLCASIALQQLHKPFTEDLLDRMELYALLTSFFTLYFSLFVLSQKWVDFAAAMIVAINVAYVVYVVRKLYETSTDSVAAGAAVLEKVRRGSFIKRIVRKLTGSSDTSDAELERKTTVTVEGSMQGGGGSGGDDEGDIEMRTNPMASSRAQNAAASDPSTDDDGGGVQNSMASPGGTQMGAAVPTEVTVLDNKKDGEPAFSNNNNEAMAVSLT